MKVIRNGGDATEAKIFVCKNCESIFTAEKSEYQKTENGYSAKCPVCNTDTTA